MSSVSQKSFNYPIAINVSVLKYTKIENVENENWSFNIQFISNVTTWDITRTLSQFLELDINVNHN